MQHVNSRNHRRRFLSQSVGAGLGLFASAWLPRVAQAQGVLSFGESELRILSDGQLTLPKSFVFPESLDQSALDTLLKQHNLNTDTMTPDCNVTLWKANDRLVLFDVGSGPNFMPTAGKLVNSLEAAGIDPADITDVVFTHAHPDHLWGLLDDFDELICPDANYHMSATEWDYWRSPATLASVPESQKTFVVGAQNRFPVIEPAIQLFKAGQEILPGLEAVDTSGHTPGHSSFKLHSGNESMVVIGDALTNIAVSFAKPQWPTGSDQNPVQGATTRLKLLDRLAADQSRIIGYHLPHPGIGRVKRKGDHYQFVVA